MASDSSVSDYDSLGKIGPEEERARAVTLRRRERSRHTSVPHGMIGAAVFGKQKMILAEVLSTERDYVRDVQSVILGYQMKIKHLLTNHERDVLFGNINALHALHCEFLAKLEDCIEIAPAFVGTWPRRLSLCVAFGPATPRFPDAFTFRG